MRVFLTGGTGLIGTAVVSELLSHGHTVVGLARSDTSAAALTAAGVEPLRGGLADLDVLRSGAAGADGVVHLAFDHDVAGVETVVRAVTEEGAAVAAMGEVLVGTDRPFAVVSGTPPIPGRVATEADTLVLGGPLAGRGRTVDGVLALADRGVRSAVVRMPRTVHRDGHGGFAGLLTGMARAAGEVTHPGDGSQRWPACHALDAASLFRIVLERAPAGTTWHAVAEEGVTVRDTAEVIGRRLGLPVRTVPTESFGPLGDIFATDGPASSAHTRATLGWEPTHEGLLADLEHLQP